MQVFQLCSLLCALIKIVVSCNWFPAEYSWPYASWGLWEGSPILLLDPVVGP